MNECIELGCHAEPAQGDAYCLPHRAQFWPLWAAHPLDERCPPGCPSRPREWVESGGGIEGPAPS